MKKYVHGHKKVIVRNYLDGNPGIHTTILEGRTEDEGQPNYNLCWNRQARAAGLHCKHVRGQKHLSAENGDVFPLPWVKPLPALIELLGFAPVK